jgi:hypothetical protein
MMSEKEEYSWADEFLNGLVEERKLADFNAESARQLYAKENYRKELNYILGLIKEQAPQLALYFLQSAYRESNRNIHLPSQLRSTYVPCFPPIRVFWNV